MKKFKPVPVLLISLFLLTFNGVSAIEKISPDPVACDLVGQFMEVISLEDPAERLRGVLPLVHKSLLTSDLSDLISDIKQFSYKKACANVRFYRIPPVISEVHKGREITVGFEETAQKGRIDKYFVNKKEGVNGRPAPIHVFWPEDGGRPSIINFGSL